MSETDYELGHADGHQDATDFCLRLSEWKPIESAPDYKTLLTIHKDDLYPVCAFYFVQDGKRFWMRVIEGPEDIIRPEQGDHGELYRAPTHWMYPPSAPISVESELQES